MLTFFWIKKPVNLSFSILISKCFLSKRQVWDTHSTQYFPFNLPFEQQDLLALSTTGWDYYFFFISKRFLMWVLGGDWMYNLITLGHAIEMDCQQLCWNFNFQFRERHSLQFSTIKNQLFYYKSQLLKMPKYGVCTNRYYRTCNTKELQCTGFAVREWTNVSYNKINYLKPLPFTRLVHFNLGKNIPYSAGSRSQ